MRSADDVIAFEGSLATWDIEDIVAAGKRKKSCPYFASRELMQSADVVFCPYNYLIDPSVRDSIGIKLEGNVVILDEGHNVEDTAREASSITMKVPELEAIVVSQEMQCTLLSKEMQCTLLSKEMQCTLLSKGMQCTLLSKEMQCTLLSHPACCPVSRPLGFARSRSAWCSSTPIR